MTQGALQQTGNALDLAVEGEGFFQIQTANGLRYTRDGGFNRAQNGQLVTAAGEPVLSTTGKPIPVPPGEVSVGVDGVLSVAGGTVATVGVFTFPSGTQLTPEGANRYIAPEGVAPVLSKQASVHQRTLEAANQGMIPGMLNLILIQREAEMMQKALTVFHTEFNKIATEDLPKV
jgi:flagellar basal-body rod protein FlgF/flagellar basal-body rod protein FlgG